jgi:hypothetical protein
MNYNKYIGLPYATNGRDESGIDCWGLVRLFYKQEYNIDLPSYTEEYDGAYDTRILQMMDLYKNNWAQVQSPEVGSVIVFNILGEPFHVGIYIGEDKFIHARDGMDSVVESVNSPRWNKRIEGYYKYSTQSNVELVGKPHPFKQISYSELAIPGSTLSDVSKALIDTYKISDYFAKNLILFLDGVKVPQSEWDTVRVQAGQNIVYKVIPEGKSTMRLIATIAVLYIALNFGADVGSFLGMTETVAGVETVTATGKIIGTMAINMAGMALINAAFPIRPLNGKDPGSAAPVNAFSGAANQANRYGAIPVVLGKMRVNAMLGAVPYVETLTDTSLLNLSLVWGFGPLLVEDICVGAKSIKEIYYTNQASTTETTPVPVTILGTPHDNVDAFDALYPSDVEQLFPQIELVNNTTDGNTPAIVELTNFAEDIDVAFTFPEGMRRISVKDGKISEASCAIEVKLRKEGETTWGSLPAYHLGNYNSGTLDSQAHKAVISGAPSVPDSNGDNRDLYKFYTLAMSPGGGIDVFSGAATDTISADPSPWLKARYAQESFASFTGTGSTYERLPIIPSGYRKLYTLCFQGINYLPGQTVSHISGAVGLGLTSVTRNLILNSNGTPATDGNGDPMLGSTWTASIGAGYFIDANSPAPGTPQEIFTSRSFSGILPIGQTNNYGGWAEFLQTYRAWESNSSNTFDKTATVTFPYAGYYEVEAASDNYGEVYIDSARLIYLPEDGWATTAKNWFYAEAGSTHTVRMSATNTGGAAAAALRITYTANSGLNVAGAAATNLVFGSSGLFSMRKDAFNFVLRIRGLPRAKYSIRIIRTNDDRTEREEDKDYRYYSKAVVYSVVGYNKQTLDANNNLVPIRVVKNPPKCHLARTFVRLQSTNKVNGSLDGVNALVTTVAHVLNRDTNDWKTTGPTNNPAALFLYVLMHPANAYRVADNITDAAKYVDLNALAEWFKFCQPMTYANNTYSIDTTRPWLNYNAVLSNVTSVMDVLKDICSAGKASPNYIDGKWTVVIDKPRTAVVQHFTPHNSWGFESTKILPRIPDAFRITIADEEKGYQANEYRVYNVGKNEANAELFEEVNLPGVTNFEQAKHIARWHMAQLKLRPEVYSLNVDFEYLVCNRGDLVRVTHDVPYWGAGSGRINSCQVGSSTITLSEEIYIDNNIPYNIRVRTNTGASVVKIVSSPTLSAYYKTLTLTTPITAQDNINIDDLFMIGQVSQESQQLIVLSVETSNNVTAKLTLADYSPQIYTADLSGYLAYNANITSTGNYLVNSLITQSPEIVSVNSDSALSEQIASGSYTNTAIIGYTNSPGLSGSAERIQLQVIPGNVMFDTSSPSYYNTKDSSSISIQQLITGVIYKARVRYTNNAGTVFGPWSKIYWFTNGGKTINPNEPPTLSLDLETKYIVVNPVNIILPSDFNCYVYRLYRSSGTADIWDTTPIIPEIQSIGQGKFNLVSVPQPRISETGVTYRVACRMLDKTNNYSSTTTYGTIVIKTIV